MLKNYAEVVILMTTGAMQGLLYCGNILIPSLFPFIVLSAFIVKSGLADFVGKFLSPVTKKLFHTDGSVGAVILLGFIGGFPVGAKGVASLYDEGKIDLETAKSLTMFLVGGGPGFVVFVVGNVLYQSTVAGLLLWLCQIITQLILGIFSCRKIKFNPHPHTKVKRLPISNAIVDSTESGINSIMLMCGMVVLFSSVFAVFENLQLTEIVSDLLIKASIPKSVSESLLNVLWEVTNGCNVCHDNVAPVWLMSFALGWGGLCVHFQIYALTTSINLPKIKFTLYRLAQGVISSLLTAIIFTFYNPTQNVYYSSATHTTPSYSGNYIGSIALIAMCILFTMCLETSDEVMR